MWLLGAPRHQSEEADMTGQAKQRFREGGSFEDEAGYSRAVRLGNMIAVSGTTGRPEVLGLGTRAQAVDCLQRVVAAVERLGGSRDGIYRTRLFLAPGADWQEAGSAHLEVLGDVRPANTTLFVHSLIGAGLLVEAEADAWADVPPRAGGADASQTARS
jgi:enamine deaminase RidA (YjgF/YER057c/UK114 family)